MYVNLSATGTAINTKGYPAIDTGNDITYLRHLPHTAQVIMKYWPDNVVEKKVKVTGALTEEHFPTQPTSGPQSQTFSGDQLFITDPDWQLL